MPSDSESQLTVESADQNSSSDSGQNTESRDSAQEENVEQIAQAIISGIVQHVSGRTCLAFYRGDCVFLIEKLETAHHFLVWY